MNLHQSWFVISRNAQSFEKRFRYACLRIILFNFGPIRVLWMTSLRLDSRGLSSSVSSKDASRTVASVRERGIAHPFIWSSISSTFAFAGLKVSRLLDGFESFFPALQVSDRLRPGGEPALAFLSKAQETCGFHRQAARRRAS
jgi:hypothetical protein